MGVNIALLMEKSGAVIRARAFIRINMVTGCKLQQYPLHFQSLQEHHHGFSVVFQRVFCFLAQQ